MALLTPDSRINPTRWRTAEALLAIAEDPKAPARERRLAAVAVLDICDRAEAAAADPAGSEPAAVPARTAEPVTVPPGASSAPQPHAHRAEASPAQRMTSPTHAAATAAHPSPSHRITASPSHGSPAQPRAA